MDLSNQESPPATRQIAVFAGGLAILPALAFVLSIVAVPEGLNEKAVSQSVAQASPASDSLLSRDFDWPQYWKGPFRTDWANKPMAIHDIDGELTRLNLVLDYVASDASVVDQAQAQTLYETRLWDLVGELQINASELSTRQRDALRERLQSVLFPVEMEGATRGLARGRSWLDSEIDTPLGELHLYVSATSGTARLGQGPTVHFGGYEENLEVCDQQGRCIYLDVRNLEPNQTVEVSVGVRGLLLDVVAAQ